MTAFYGDRRERSQSMVEFALIAPVLMLMVFGIIDFGRAMYYYVTISEAANDGARVAAAKSNPMPSDASVQAAVTQHAAATRLANPCANGPIVSAQVPPANTGWIYITQAPPPSAQQLSQPTPANAPGGEASAAAAGGCSAINPAFGNQALEVTVRYNFVPLTPLIQQATANQLVLRASAVYRTEY